MQEANLEASQDQFAAFKANQKEVGAGFGVNEGSTTVPAGELVAFAGVKPGERVLDVGCGTGVVAVTAARAGAHVTGLDLTPVLLERAKENASIAGVEVGDTVIVGEGWRGRLHEPCHPFADSTQSSLAPRHSCSRRLTNSKTTK